MEFDPAELIKQKEGTFVVGSNHKLFGQENECEALIKDHLRPDSQGTSCR